MDGSVVTSDTDLFFCLKPRDTWSRQQRQGHASGRSSGSCICLVAGEGFPLCLGPHAPLTVSRTWHPGNRAEAFEAGTGNEPSLEHRHVRKWMKRPEGKERMGTHAPWNLAAEQGEALGDLPLRWGGPREDQRPARTCELGVISVAGIPPPQAGESWRRAVT